MASVSRSVEAQVSAQTHTPKSSAGRLLLLIGVSLFVSTFVSDSKLARIPLQFLLKDHLHVGPVAMAKFFAVVGLAWYFKPVAGLLCDGIPLWGSRRRNYLMLAGLGSGLLWAVLGVVPHQYNPLLRTLVGANAFAVLASSAAGGLLVEAGQEQGLTGKLGALRETIISGSSLLAQPVGGFLAAREFGLTCGIGAALFLGLVPAVFFFLPEAKAAPFTGSFWGTLKERFGPVFQSRALWLAALFIFLERLSPGLGQPLFFYQTGTLHFSPQFIGGVGALSSAGAIVGALAYGWLCARLPLSRLLPLGMALSALGTLLFLGYHSHASALVIQGVSGLIGILASVALMDLGARASPAGLEATGYSLLMAAFNLGGSASDLLGSWLYEGCHLSLWTLIWISAATTALTLPALYLLPKSVLARSDRG